MSLDKAYTLFRSLGLRHLCVIPRAPDVVGVITRQDLLLDTLDSRLAARPVIVPGCPVTQSLNSNNFADALATSLQLARVEAGASDANRRSPMQSAGNVEGVGSNGSSGLVRRGGEGNNALDSSSAL